MGCVLIFLISILENVYPEYSGTSASGECHAACAKLPYRFPFCRRLSGDLSLGCHKNRVTHFPARVAFLGFNLFPKPKASKLEFRKLFFHLPAQALFIAFSRALAPSGKHPKPVALSPYEQHPSAFYTHQF